MRLVHVKYIHQSALFQVIYDLLEKSSGHLELREDPVHGIIVAGLRSIKVICSALDLFLFLLLSHLTFIKHSML